MASKSVSKIMAEAMAIPMNMENILDNNKMKWLETISAAHNTRLEFLYGGCLTTAAAMCGPEITVKISNNYTEPLNIFMVTLGYPGMGKSQSFQLTVKDAIPAIHKDILVDDFTRKGLVAHLEQTSIGFMAYEEMGGFFDNTLKRQAEGTGERAFFCKLYDGGPIQVESADSQGRLKLSKIEKPHVTPIMEHWFRCIMDWQTDG